MQLKKLFLLMLIMCLPLAFTSCDNNNEPTESPYDSYLSGTYSNKPDAKENKLELTLNEQSLTDKEVLFKSSDYKTAKITFSNIIEGEKSTTISNIALVANEEKGCYDFSGTYTASTSVKYAYSGSIGSGLLKLTLSIE
ncbi:MAG: DUF4925 domain-containing protein [Tannerellaceae bacterium]